MRLASLLPLHIGPIALLALTCVATPETRAALAVSTFDTDADGWTFVDLPSFGPYDTPLATLAVTYHAAGGHPGGHISATDPTINSFFFAAPAKFLGDRTAAYGHALRFDLRLDGVFDWEEGVDLVLVGGGQTLVRETGLNPGPDWRTFSVLLTESGWRKNTPVGTEPSPAEFQTTLGSLTALYLIGELQIGVVETAHLDNVILVPEPGQWAGLVALGLAGFALGRRRRL